MATYVLVPGGWSGGWQWRAVAKYLRIAGHEVYTPTLTGMGERVHLARPDIDLETHILDIVNVFRFEDLTNVFLVGYSYSGVVVTAVADRISERIAHLIYIDAFLPNDGQSLADIVGPEVVEMLGQIAQEHGDGWRLPHFPPDAPFRTDHLLNTTFQAIQLQHPGALALPRTFIFCTEDKEPSDLIMLPIAQAAARVKNDPTWQYYELATGHSPWETMPEALANILRISAESNIDP